MEFSEKVEIEIERREKKYITFAVKYKGNWGKEARYSIVWMMDDSFISRSNPVKTIWVSENKV